MSTDDKNWTTVSAKTKGKPVASSNKSAGAVPVLPTAEVKSTYRSLLYSAQCNSILAIKLSDSAFSAMKDRIQDETDENAVPKPASTNEKNPPAKVTKASKPATTTMTLKQALQNVCLGDRMEVSIVFSIDHRGETEAIVHTIGCEQLFARGESLLLDYRTTERCRGQSKRPYVFQGSQCR